MGVMLYVQVNRKAELLELVDTGSCIGVAQERA